MFRNYVALIYLLFGMQGAVLVAEELETLSGETYSVKLVALDINGQLKGENVPQKLAFADLRSVLWRPITAAEKNTSILAEGNSQTRYLANSLTFNGEQFQVHLSGGLQIDIPFDALKTIRFNPAAPIDPAFADALTRPSVDQDRVFIQVEKHIEAVSGLLATITEKEVTLEVSGEKRTLPREKVYGLILAQAAATNPFAITATLVEGSRVPADKFEFENATAKLHLRNGSFITIPVAQLSRLDFSTENMLFLSDLNPNAVKDTSLLLQPMPWQRDKSVGGNPLKIQDKSFEKGIGVHSRSELLFDVPPAHANSLFLAVVGIDAETLDGSNQTKGDCIMQLWVDDQLQWSSRVRGKESPLPVRVELRNAKRLKLIVEPGEDFDFADHANWGDARLLKVRP